MAGRGPTAVITDLGVLEAADDDRELVLTSMHPGGRLDDVQAATGWDLRVAHLVSETPAPALIELDALRAMVTAG